METISFINKRKSNGTSSTKPGNYNSFLIKKTNLYIKRYTQHVCFIDNFTVTEDVFLHIANKLKLLDFRKITSYGHEKINTYDMFNPFSTNAPLIYPLETSESRRFSGGIEVEQWLKMG